MTEILPRGLVLLLVTSASLACSGSSRSPQSPDPVGRPSDAIAAGTEFILVSGEDGRPVADAKVVLAGETYSPDGGGRIVISKGASYGSLLDVVAPGFLDRQTVLRRGGATRLVLWPRRTESGVDESYTAEIVYTVASTEAGAAFGQAPLRRIASNETQAVVAVSDEIRLDDYAHEAHADAVEELNSWLAGRLRYTLSPTSPGGGLVFEARVDPADDSCRARRVRAYFQGRSNGRGEIVGGSIVYCSLDIASSKTVVHELGHSLGLRHVYSHSHDVMNPFYSYDKRSRFTDREGLMMNLLFERPAGNRYPDSDRDVTGASLGSFTILCP